MNRTQLSRAVRAAANEVLRTKGSVSVVDVLIRMDRLTQADYERWRRRQVPFLERVILGNLSQHSFLCREFRAHARDVLRLKPSCTVYTSWGKGPRHLLRFSKSGAPYIEELYSTHYIGPALIAAATAKRRAAAGGTISAGRASAAEGLP